MKIKYLFILLATLIVFSYASCKKNADVEDPHNHSLLNKSIDQIRAEIAGKWQFKKGCGNGILGYTCNSN